MQAQEFSSPAAHMASLSKQSSGGSGAPASSSVLFSPLIDNYNYNKDIIDGNIPRIIPSKNKYEFYDNNSIDNFFEPYLKYNYDMFKASMEYDKMMSDTSIRRQVQDLKAAGINPYYAGKLGGASYKGVSAPYVTINPSGALSAFATFQGNQMSYDARMKEIASNEKISENTLKNQAKIAENYIANALQVANINKQSMLEVAKQNNLSAKERLDMENAIKIKIQDMYNEVLKEMQEKDIESKKGLSVDSNITKIISAGILGAGSILRFFKDRFYDGFGGFGSSIIIDGDWRDVGNLPVAVGSPGLVPAF